MGDTGGQGGCENDEAVRTEGVGTFFFSPRWHGLNPGRNGDGCVGSVRWGRAAPKNPPDLNHPAHCPFFVHLSHCYT